MKNKFIYFFSFRSEENDKFYLFQTASSEHKPTQYVRTNHNYIAQFSKMRMYEWVERSETHTKNVKKNERQK